MRRLIAFIVPLLAGVVSPCAAGDKEQFDRHVAPILAEKCLSCHSGARPKAGLDLTSAKTTFKGSKSGPVLVVGKPDESPLWTRIDKGEMPPRKPLSADEKKILKTWIAGGAVWGSDPIDPLRLTTGQRAGFDWWSLRPLRRPMPPDNNSDWPLNPIDRFVLARLETAGLKPSPEADRRTLIRRLSLDLLGLPPTWEEVDAFVRDDRPDAYEKLVDRLLASPHYGERWAQHWLDVVRYGESGGFERNDPRRSAWHYRDWVVQAFNADLPFDQFCRLQIAGDALRPGDAEALKATGYLVAGIHNTVLPELKALKDAAFHDELEDLVGNVGQTFLGMTANCARCHDHKFDPISQLDYYRLASALSGVRHAEVELPRQSSKESERLAGELAEIAKRLAALEAPARKAILAAGKAPVADGPAPIAAWDFRSGGKDLIGKLDAQPSGGARFTAEGLVLNGKTALARTAAVPRSLKEKTLEAWVTLDNLEQRGGGVMTVETFDGGIFDAIVYGERQPKRWLAGSDFFRRTQDVTGPLETAAGRPIHIAVAFHGDGTIVIYRDGVRYGQPYVSKGPPMFEAGDARISFGVRHGDVGGNKMFAGVIQRARLYDRALSENELAASAKVDGFVSEAELAARLGDKERAERTALGKQRDDLETRFVRIRSQKGTTVYTNRSAAPETMRLMHRGQVTDPGDIVAPGGLTALGKAEFNLSPNADEGKRRLKLAEWVTSPDNPLFARVMVNRLWHHHFGVGIVETPSDFGFNGGRPSHPELLEWLAAEFVEKGYRLKDMHRLIVTSRTYRQSSLARADGLKKDADTRLLWRKRPVRIEGEVLRDSLLTVSGLLERTVGGQGLSDYKETGGAGTIYYEPFDPVGPQYQRRSLYRFRPRGANLGLLDAFDCPDPAGSAPRRNVTTTPLQALALWNGPFALRMADALADRVRAAKIPEGDVVAVYRLVLQRNPTETERGPATRLVEQHGVRALARVLFNSNEFLVIE